MKHPDRIRTTSFSKPPREIRWPEIAVVATLAAMVGALIYVATGVSL